jgi:hypothetical protein
MPIEASDLANPSRVLASAHSRLIAFNVPANCTNTNAVFDGDVLQVPCKDKTGAQSMVSMTSHFFDQGKLVGPNQCAVHYIEATPTHPAALSSMCNVGSLKASMPITCQTDQLSYSNGMMSIPCANDQGVFAASTVPVVCDCLGNQRTHAQWRNINGKLAPMDLTPLQKKCDVEQAEYKNGALNIQCATASGAWGTMQSIAVNFDDFGKPSCKLSLQSTPQAPYGYGVQCSA